MLNHRVLFDPCHPLVTFPSCNLILIPSLPPVTAHTRADDNRCSEDGRRHFHLLHALPLTLILVPRLKIPLNLTFSMPRANRSDLQLGCGTKGFRGVRLARFRTWVWATSSLFDKFGCFRGVGFGFIGTFVSGQRLRFHVPLPTARNRLSRRLAAPVCFTIAAEPRQTNWIRDKYTTHTVTMVQTAALESVAILNEGADHGSER